jgi:hypothetical protein
LYPLRDTLSFFSFLYLKKNDRADRQFRPAALKNILTRRRLSPQKSPLVTDAITTDE